MAGMSILYRNHWCNKVFFYSFAAKRWDCPWDHLPIKMNCSGHVKGKFCSPDHKHSPAVKTQLCWQVFFFFIKDTLVWRMQKDRRIDSMAFHHSPTWATAALSAFVDGFIWGAVLRINTLSDIYIFFYERHQLTDHLLEPWESREEKEKAQDLQDNVHSIGTRDRGCVLNDSCRSEPCYSSTYGAPIKICDFKDSRCRADTNSWKVGTNAWPLMKRGGGDCRGGSG